MKHFEKNGLYSHIVPAARLFLFRHGDQWFDRESAEHWLNAQVFDCRELPIDFVIDTGRATFHELEQKGDTLPGLPFDDCYFEFENATAIFAARYMNLEFGKVADDDHPADGVEYLTMEQSRQRNKELTAEWDKMRVHDPDYIPEGAFYRIGLHAFPSWAGKSVEEYADLLGVVMDANGKTTLLEDGEFTRRDDGEGDFFRNFHEANELRTYHPIGIGGATTTLLNATPPRMTNVAGYNRTERAKYLLLGVLTLLDEKLLLETVMPDPAPKLNKKRFKQGRLPVSSATHILQIDVPAVHFAAKRTTISAHESPALHWRRGHWRVLHRGSEFEDRAWVRKCLVGDPSKGFVGKSYRLVSGIVPMIQPSEPQLPELVGVEKP